MLKIMYIPGGVQFICEVDSSLLAFLHQEYCKTPTLVSARFEACAHYILSEMGHSIPSNLEEACNAYFCITTYIEFNFC